MLAFITHCSLVPSVLSYLIHSRSRLRFHLTYSVRLVCRLVMTSRPASRHLFYFFISSHHRSVSPIRLVLSRLVLASRRRSCSSCPLSRSIALFVPRRFVSPHFLLAIAYPITPPPLRPPAFPCVPYEKPFRIPFDDCDDDGSDGKLS